MINYFNVVEYLEPKCPGCGVKLDYGVNTEYNEKINSHVCLNCGTKI